MTMPSGRNTFRFAKSVALAASLLGTGCLEGADADAPEAIAPEAETAKLVHELDEGDGHTLEFYDLGYGLLGVKEEMEPTDHAKLKTLEGTTTLSQLYRSVRAAGPIPEAIVAADDHSARTAKRLEALRAASGVKAPAEVAPAPASAISTAPDDVQLTQGAATATCSADYYKDNWGAKWWVNNFGLFWEGPAPKCNGFITVDHVENWGSAQYFFHGGPKQYKQLEGDFNVAGRTIIKTKEILPGAPWRVSIDATVSPRKMSVWTFLNPSVFVDYKIEGYSPCNHLMTAFAYCHVIY
jgi:hypothetical protein